MKNFQTTGITLIAACLLGGTLTACSNHIPSPALRQKGEQAMMIHDWPAAANWYSQLVERDQTDWRAQAALGRAALESGNLRRARQALEIAAALRPADNAIARDLADTLEQQEAWDDLFAYLGDRANTTSSSSDWLRLGRVAIEADDPDTARVAIRTAIAVDGGTDIESYLQAARLSRRLGDEQDAFQSLSLAWNIDPSDADVRTALLDLGVVPGPTMRLTTGQ